MMHTRLFRQIGKQLAAYIVDTIRVDTIQDDPTEERRKRVVMMQRRNMSHAHVLSILLQQRKNRNLLSLIL